MSRVSYLFRRVMETPAEALLRKLWLRVKPYVYAAGYARQRNKHSLIGPDKVAAVIAALSGLACVSDVASDADYRKRAMRRAASIRAGRFPVLGYGETDIPRGSGWHRDSFHDYHWPCRFFPKVDFLAGVGRADVKIPWELSRLQFLVWLAEGALLDQGGAERCVADFEAILLDWISANPAGFGINWTCSMEVAIRSVNLVFAAAWIAPRLSTHCQEALVASLFEHRAFLRRFPEYSDVNGNHYLAGLMGIAVLESVLSGIEGSVFLEAVAAFAAEADRQFEASGAHLEYSTVYHRLCMDMIAVVHALASRSGGAAAIPLTRVLARAMAFADAVASPGGMLPIFGDCDSGHVLWFGADARRLDAMRAYCNGLPACGPHADLASFLGRFRRNLAPLFPESRCGAGICGPFASMRNGSMTVIARHGPQGLVGRAPHDHDDALGIWVFIDDDDLLVDIGCLGYTLDPQQRRASIVSTGHPVWSPAGGERFTPVDGSIFLTVRGAPSAKVQLDQDASAIICKLELRGALGRSLAERRWIVLSDRLRIEDRIHLKEPGEIEMLLRLGPEFHAQQERADEAIMILRCGGDRSAELRFDAADRLDVWVGKDTWAPQYGCENTIAAIMVRSGQASEHLVCWTLACHERPSGDPGAQ